MSEDDWSLDPSLAVTVIEFEFVVDGMIRPDGRTSMEGQAEMTDAIEAAASAAAANVGASLAGVKWTISRRPRT